MAIPRIRSIEPNLHRKSSDAVEKYSPGIEAITIFGGGRWARVLASELCSISSPTVKITLYSPHNAGGILAWAASSGFSGRIDATSDLPRSSLAEQSAVIVANEVRHHVEAAQRAILAGVPTLVEKPLSLTATSVHLLIENALCRNVRLGAAHVFRYASYLEAFGELVSGIGRVVSLQLRWTEPRFETRYGERKRYDPGVPVFMDLLPHILSIVHFLTSGHCRDSRLVHFGRGGADVELEFTVGDTLCNAVLARNGDRRRRELRVKTEQETIELDFTQEPGTVLRNGKSVSGDPHWATTPHPVARMLNAFLAWSLGGEGDSRLDVTFGARACEMSDGLLIQYRSLRREWLDSQSQNSHLLNEDLRYSVMEMLHFENPRSRLEVDGTIEHVEQSLMESFGSNVARKLAKKDNPERFVKTLIQ